MKKQFESDNKLGAIGDILKPKTQNEIEHQALKISDPNELLSIAINKLKNINIVKIALSRQADVNRISSVDINDINMIKTLINDSEGVLQPSGLIYKALKLNLQDDIIKLIEDSRLNPAQRNCNVLIWSLGFGLSKITNYLLNETSFNYDFNKDADSLAEALSISIARGKNEVLKIVLQDKRIDPSKDCNKPIKVAAQFGNLQAVKMLLNDNRVDPSEKDIQTDEYNYALNQAIENGHSDIVQLLLKDKRVSSKIKKNKNKI